jgi:hypothetical protein
MEGFGARMIQHPAERERKYSAEPGNLWKL